MWQYQYHISAFRRLQPALVFESNVARFLPRLPQSTATSDRLPPCTTNSSYYFNLSLTNGVYNSILLHTHAYRFHRRRTESRRVPRWSPAITPSISTPSSASMASSARPRAPSRSSAPSPPRPWAPPTSASTPVSTRRSGRPVFVTSPTASASASHARGTTTKTQRNHCIHSLASYPSQASRVSPPSPSRSKTRVPQLSFT